ncbi:MAG: cytochrome c1 [Pseudomonadota bacterium]
MMKQPMFMLRTVAIAAIASLGLSAAALAAGGGPKVEKQSWSFSGITGQFDEAQLQRGFQVYKEVCAACHGLARLPFRSLTGVGGPNFPENDVKRLAAEYEVTDGPNDDGEMFKRPGRMSDTFPPLYANEKEARSIHNGAYPLDLSLITKARGIPHAEGIFTHVLTMGQEILTGYQEGGADYLYALLVGYRDEAPEGFNLQDGLYYNVSYSGQQIAMPDPFAGGDGQVEYQDGTPATVENYARDVTAFLFWVADPTHDQRKQTGWLVLIYLLITSVLLYLAKLAIWRNVDH